MKRGKKMILLLVLLAVMIGGYYGVQQLNKTESVSETSGSFDLTEKTADDLTGLSWTADENSWVFQYADGEWKTAEEPSWPVDQDVLQGLADQLAGLKGTRKLENIQNAADYGLETPTFAVTATWKDGTSTTYTMGDATPFADGYYLSLSGQENTIYTIASSLSSVFSKTQKDMAALEAIPSVTEVKRLTVGETMDVIKEDSSRTVDPEQLWYDAKTEEPLDGSKIESFAGSAAGIAWSELVTANADEETLKEWQLDDASAVAVTWSGGEESATVLFGALNEDSNYYARLPGSPMVYTVDSGSVSALLTASKDDLWICAVMTMPYDSLAYAEFETEKGSWRMEKKAAEEEKADGAEAAEGTTSETTEGTAEETAEDTAASEAEEARKNLWALVTALTAADRPEQAVPGDPLLTIHAVSTDGAETTAVFTTYSADQYLAQTDDGRTLLVAADKVDAIIRTIRTMQ